MAGKSNVHAYSAHWNKVATCDFGCVTMKSCESMLFFVYIWIISWEATNRGGRMETLLVDALPEASGRIP